ncbi:DUF7344 domain-containing protein [Haladaptatus caseinilyticus]|uniref:DUF7344 domain-containing protein n=1 Tax=Haladaptatus caseinilyticus TaxID=2993314 RepID=UPI00224A68C8|nr:hypothetical protein [Haladaptatus caseinilyticus]
METDSLPNQPSDGRTAAPSLDAVFDVLANLRRRFALSYLQDRSTPIAIADLIAEVAAHQHETTPNEIPDEIVQRERIRFHHIHLPKLVDANLVAVDTDRNTVVATDALQAIDHLLAIATENDP